MTPTPTPKTALDALMAAHAATTEGKWYFEPEYEYITASDEQSMVAEIRGFGSGEPTQANGRFIALAHNSLPAIAEYVRELEAIREAARAYLEAIDIRRAAQKEGLGAGYANCVGMVTDTEAALRGLVKGE